MSQKCSERSSSYICWKIGYLQGLDPFWLKSLFGEVIFEHVQNGSPKSVGSKKWVKKCREKKNHRNLFLMAKGPLPYDQKKFLVYYTNMTKMRL